jgi:hypothetical protein
LLDLTEAREAAWMEEVWKENGRGELFKYCETQPTLHTVSLAT